MINLSSINVLTRTLLPSSKPGWTTGNRSLPILESLRSACGEFICGDAMVIFHGGAVKDGFLLEAAYPVSRPVETDSINTRILESVPVLSTLHQGPHQTIRETVLRVYDYLDQHAWTTSLFRREIYHLIDPISPERNITEVQIVLHEWDRLLGEGAEHFLGVDARGTLMQGIESITPNSSFTEYTTWITGAMQSSGCLNRRSGEEMPDIGELRACLSTGTH